MQPIWQRGLTYGGGTPAFVACDALNRLPRILGVAGVEISLQCLLCLLAHRVQKLIQAVVMKLSLCEDVGAKISCILLLSTPETYFILFS